MVQVELSLDDLSNGSYENISKYIGSNNFDFIKGDIRDYSGLESVKELILFYIKLL